MISVFIASHGDADGLVRTLAPLVTAAVEGIVSDVTVVFQTVDPACEAVADETGCAYRPAAELDQTVRSARGEWCLLLEEGAVAGGNWTDAIRDFMANGNGRGRFRRTSSHRGLRGLFARRGALVDGLLLPMAEATAMAKSARTLDDLARGRAAHRIDAVLHRPG